MVAFRGEIDRTCKLTVCACMCVHAHVFELLGIKPRAFALNYTLSTF